MSGPVPAPVPGPPSARPAPAEPVRAQRGSSRVRTGAALFAVSIVLLPVLTMAVDLVVFSRLGSGPPSSPVLGIALHLGALAIVLALRIAGVLLLSPRGRRRMLAALLVVLSVAAEFLLPLGAQLVATRIRSFEAIRVLFTAEAVVLDLVVVACVLSAWTIARSLRWPAWAVGGVTLLVIGAMSLVGSLVWQTVAMDGPDPVAWAGAKAVVATAIAVVALGAMALAWVLGRRREEIRR